MPYGIYDGVEVIARFVTPLTLKSNQPYYFSDTLSLKRQVVKRAVQRWEIETQLEPLSHYGNKLLVNLVTKGYSETVQIIVPQNVGAVYARTSTSVPLGTGLVDSTTVSVSSNSGLIPAGTYIKFDNHSKVYMTVTDVNGTGNMEVYPPLRQSVSGNSFTYRDDVIMSCLYDPDTVMGMVYRDGILMDIGTIKLVEKL